MLVNGVDAIDASLGFHHLSGKDFILRKPVVQSDDYCMGYRSKAQLPCITFIFRLLE